jgi:hypothetical protein
MTSVSGAFFFAARKVARRLELSGGPYSDYGDQRQAA